MPTPYIVIDHWFPVARELFKIHRFFFLTNRPALRDAPEGGSYIVDNGTYYYRRPRLELILRAAKKGYYFILPDYLADSKRTLSAHLSFFEEYEEQAKRLGFIVLQGRTVDEMLELLDLYREYGLTITKRVAIGGPREREHRKIMIQALYSELRRRGFWVHALGFSTNYCDTFDTISPFTWWFGRKFSEQALNEFLKYFEKWKARWI